MQNRSIVSADETQAEQPEPTQPQPLSPRMTQVLGMLADGATYDQVAKKLGISNSTVRAHTEGAKRRLNVGTRAEAIARASAAGLIRV